MAGHSKWANIQHRKGRQDAKRGKLWTKIIREITVAAREAGPDPEANPRLRLACEKAAAANMPKDNVNRAIQRGAGGADGDSFEEVRFEGYGVGGAAVIVDCMTDNRQRTVSDVRHAFSKHGGNLGVDGSVVFQFQHCGQFLFAPGSDEDRIMEAALEAGAEDILTDEEGLIEVVCEPSAYAQVKQALDQANLEPEVSGVVMKALNETELEGQEAETMQKMLDALEGLDDVQEVFTTAVMDETY
ncbi:MAG TPA: YebC/PmpR family DNA-binding transcriptional regulator [Candidatus Paenalcaligenes intestinipullorum]|uniref:Probable transcriptional regulatory protein H9906_07735 n=1 Tax=Candidatus Paenalcaligenes intestinipullorum TaxID=2838718 RepID=A0A9D2RLK9_9BURK|nr:YebC/PmpR family DNA-binding transcriptional regulator [Candidatus Paenalcaligenes intestinipullorum]